MLTSIVTYKKYLIGKYFDILCEGNDHGTKCDEILQLYVI